MYGRKRTRVEKWAVCLHAQVYAEYHCLSIVYSHKVATLDSFFYPEFNILYLMSILHDYLMDLDGFSIISLYLLDIRVSCLDESNIPLHSVVIHTYSFKVLKSLHYKQCSKLFLIISQVSYYNCLPLGSRYGALQKGDVIPLKIFFYH